ncbi:MAG TPA: hypothetical protein VM008_11975 [Phycisphaerae bacterium]|nr:hypothetical protein [Phycisphaerae bacterium]
MGLTGNNSHSADQLLAKIQDAWPDDDPLPEGQIFASFGPWGYGKASDYFVGRRLSQIDLRHPHIIELGTYNEAFTEEAKSYYAGVYLANMVRAYQGTPMWDGEGAVAHFLDYLLRKGHSLPFSPKQSSVIADVLNFVADRIDLEFFWTEEEVDKLLKAIKYWRERSRPPSQLIVRTLDKKGSGFID